MGSDSLSILTPTKPTPIPLPNQEEDASNPSTALLSFNTDSSSSAPTDPPHRRTATTILFISLLLITCIALSAAVAFAFLFFSSSSSSSYSSSSSLSSPSSPPATSPISPPATSHIEDQARPLVKLQHPVVLLISSDGFRFGYQFKTATPNIGRLIGNGTEAEMGLIPVFPTLTFPNHYSIVTGLYPAYHGIINNHFVDPHTGEVFTMASHERKWWLGEPLWEVVVSKWFFW